MSTPIRFSLLVILFSGMFYSCEKDLAVTSQYEEKLVLNGITLVDEPITIELSKSKNILDSTDKIDWVRNADVYVTVNNNNFQEKLKYDSLGVYRSTHIASYGEKFSIEIVHAKYKDVSAEAVMPAKSEALVKYINEVPGERNSVFELTIENKKQNNFYIWEMFYSNTSGSGSSTVQIVSTDDKTDNILPDQSHGNKLIFIEGNQVEGKQLSSSFIANVEEKDLGETTVRLITVNKEMYNYYRTLELYKNSQNNGAQPIEIYSNITNGLGIFGAISETNITIER